MSEPTNDWDLELTPRDRIPAAFDPQVLKTALQDISALNEIMLESLVACARSPVLEFPLERSVRSRFAQLTADQQVAIAECGVLLADMEFGNLGFWQTVPSLRYAPEAIRQSTAWLDGKDAVSYAIAVLFGGLYVLRSAPNLALLVLGMTPPVATIYGHLSQRTLLSTARACPHLVKPRWSEQPDTWARILDFGEEIPTLEAWTLNAHVYKLSAAEMPRLQPYFRSHSVEGPP